MTEEERIEQLEKEVEILKKRVDFFYNEIRPEIKREMCQNKHYEADKNGKAIYCSLNHSCRDCPSYKEGA